MVEMTRDERAMCEVYKLDRELYMKKNHKHYTILMDIIKNAPLPRDYRQQIRDRMES